MTSNNISLDSRAELFSPRESISQATAEAPKAEATLESYKEEQNVQMQAGIKAFSEAVENDPVAQLVSYLA